MESKIPKEKTCEDCDATFLTISSRKLTCDGCSYKRQQASWKRNTQRRMVENAEDRKAGYKRWRENHLEQDRQRSREHMRELREKFPEEMRDYQRHYYRDNPEKYKEYSAQSYDKHKRPCRERENAKARSRYAANKEKYKETKRRNLVHYRARLANAEGSWTVEQFVALCEAREYRCYYCGEFCEKVTVEHILPLSRGSSNDIGNIAPACGPCNFSKSGKTEAEFLEHLQQRRVS
jgi:HNH endonuclease